MSEELRDLRARITGRTWAVLEAQAQASGKEKSELVREILDGWAAREIHEFSLLGKYLKAEGLDAASAGSGGRGW
jgi:hypothetical protein